MTSKRYVAAFTLLVTLILVAWFYHLISRGQAPDVSVARLVVGYFDARSCVFPTEPETLDVMLRNLRRSPNGPCLRKRSWALFDSLSGATRNSDPPWLNWCAIYQSDQSVSYLVCPPGGLPADPPQGAIPQVSPIGVRNLITAQFPRQLPFTPPLLADAWRTMQEVLLDPATSQTILTCFQSGDQSLDPSSGLREFALDLSRKQPACKSKTRDFTGLLDESSTAVKLVWSVVRNKNDLPPVWDSTLKGASSTIGIKAVAWKQGVQLNLDDRPCPRIFAQSLTRDPVGKTGSYSNDPTVPLNCFYWTKVTDADLNAALSFELKFTSFTSEPGIGKRLKANDRLRATTNDENTYYLLLMGFHVTTRTTTDWTWQTYWWSGRTSVSCAEDGEECLYSDNPMANSDTVPEMRWSHYVLNTTLGQPEENRPATPTFDPYLEGQDPNGPNTNCLNCHQYAVFHPDKHAAAEFFEAEQQRGSSGRNLPMHGCTTSEEGDRDGKDNDLIQDGIKTDCLWSLASSNVPKQGGKTLLEILETTFDLRIKPSRVP